jgi:hypothetical protein
MTSSAQARLEAALGRIGQHLGEPPPPPPPPEPPVEEGSGVKRGRSGSGGREHRRPPAPPADTSANVDMIFMQAMAEEMGGAGPVAVDRVEHKFEPKFEPRFEPKFEPKFEPMFAPKFEASPPPPPPVAVRQPSRSRWDEPASGLFSPLRAHCTLSFSRHWDHHWPYQPHAPT